jgi:dienelactone hydrolase
MLFLNFVLINLFKMRKDFEILLPDKELLRITAYGDSIENYKYVLIYVHGFKGFKDWGFVPYFAEKFAKMGIYVITFNFSLNGIGENLLEFTEIDKFAKNTFSREVFELEFLLKMYKEGFFGKTDSKKLTLLGHSRGGAIAAFCGDNDIVDKVALWAAIAKLDRYTERQKEIWRKDGYFEIINTRTNQMMRLNVSLLDDIEANKNDRFSMQKAIAKLNKPLLIAHGSNDLTVPIEEGYLLYNWSNQNYSKFITVDKGSHTFDITHPFSGTNDKFEFLLNETFNFIIE